MHLLGPSLTVSNGVEGAGMPVKRGTGDSGGRVESAHERDMRRWDWGAVSNKQLQWVGYSQRDHSCMRRR